VREVLDARFSLVRAGRQWRPLPRESPPRQTGSHWFRRWRPDGTRERAHTVLGERVRVAVGRDPQPTAGSLDGQSLKAVGVGGVRGFDGAKQVSGRARQLLVETQGLVLRAVAHTGALQDRAAVPRVPTGVGAVHPRLRRVWLDQGSTGSGTAWIEGELGWSVEIVAHPREAGGLWWPAGGDRHVKRGMCRRRRPAACLYRFGYRATRRRP
jgi:putative transposase